MYAPIALFTYNRPDKTQRVLESLMQNAESKDSDLFIFSDGPKNEKAVEGVRKNREYIHQVQESSREFKRFKDVTIIEREKNWGLANSLIAGITEVINKYGRIIVVEDDLILSPYFLKFMNDGLEKYKDEDKVGAISSYIYPDMLDMPENFLISHFHCWGWATWERSWKLLNTNSKFLLRKLRFRKTKFDVGGYAGAYGNLYCQKIGLVDSWWVYFYASLFINDKLILYPGLTLVNNQGNDGTGTHGSKQIKIKEMELANNPIKIIDLKICESEVAYNAMKKHFKAKSTPRKLLHVIYYFLKRLFYIDCL